MKVLSQKLKNSGYKNYHTVAKDILLKMFGLPNGKGTAQEEARNDSWFFKGYSGKSGTTL